jgi:hypothetical protein
VDWSLFNSLCNCAAEATGLAVMASLNADASSAQIRSALERDVIELVQSSQQQ